MTGAVILGGIFVLVDCYQILSISRQSLFALNSKIAVKQVSSIIVLRTGA